jgi:predicted ABC-type transport system involved in lysophospholipase L1 biosynthesis ATPase subunit
LLPGLTAAENVSPPLEQDGLLACKAQVAALKTLGWLGLSERASSCRTRCPAANSSGWRSSALAEERRLRGVSARVKSGASPMAEGWLAPPGLAHAAEPQD